jgi:hypothetical protein
MPFSEMFAENMSDCIVYNGEKVYSIDRYKLTRKHKVKFTFISTNSSNEQCIILILVNAKCNIYWNEKQYEIPKSKFPTLDIFESHYGKECILDVDLQEGDIGICNGSIRILGDKRFIEYASDGTAMKIVEISPTRKRYYCNDYENDDDFDDLVFEMEIME